MRTILFRGKRIDGGEWVDGSLICSYGRCWIKDNEDKFTNPIKLDGISADFRCVKVDPATVGQYTGLQDNNGQKIFEGDILRNVDNQLVDFKPFKVVWNIDSGGWFWNDGSDNDALYSAITKYCEVIGNITDNPELEDSCFREEDVLDWLSELPYKIERSIENILKLEVE